MKFSKKASGTTKTPENASRATSSIISGGAKQTKYQLGAELARGGGGVVYLAKVLSTKENVALKRIQCNSLVEANEALQEALIMSRLQSPFVLCCRDTFLIADHRHGEMLYTVNIVQDYCSGGDLMTAMAKVAFDKRFLVRSADQIQRHERMPIKTWVYQLAAAVAALHEHDVIHRDIKLENVLLTEDSDVQLCDFGCSLFSHKDGNLGAQAHEMAGSTFYLAPELIGFGRNQQKASYKASKESDTWSAGVTMLELITGWIFSFRGHDASLGVIGAKALADGMYSVWHEQKELVFHEVLPLLAAQGKVVDSMLNLEPNERPAMSDVQAALNDMHMLSSASSTLSTSNMMASLSSLSTSRSVSPQSTISPEAHALRRSSHHAGSLSARLHTGTLSPPSSGSMLGRRFSTDSCIRSPVGGDCESSESSFIDSAGVYVDSPSGWSKTELLSFLKTHPNYSADMVQTLVQLKVFTGRDLLRLKPAKLAKLSKSSRRQMTELQRAVQELQRLATDDVSSLSTTSIDDTKRHLVMRKEGRSGKKRKVFVPIDHGPSFSDLLPQIARKIGVDVDSFVCNINGSSIVVNDDFMWATALSISDQYGIISIEIVLEASD